MDKETILIKFTRLSNILTNKITQNKIFLLPSVKNQKLSFDLNIISNNVDSQADHVVNFPILVLKYYLYQCKCLGKPPYKYEIWQEFNVWHKIEGQIARRPQKIFRHNQKWRPVECRTFINPIVFLCDYKNTI